MKQDSNKWICSQLGTREYYLVPRALRSLNQEVSMITDFWIKPSSLYYKYYSKSRTRFHKEIHDLKIYDFNEKFLFKRIFQKNTNWDIYYDTLAAEKLAKIFNGQANLFTNCYSSLLTLKKAKSLGLKNYYQQINPGPEEAEIVKRIYLAEFGTKYKPAVPDDKYWDRWRLEIEFTDYIIVNSKWSKTLMIKSGVDEKKITIIPFIYEGPDRNIDPKEYTKFSKEKPLRILFLGSVSMRKGFHVLKKAMESLVHEPVVLDVVGRLNGPEELLQNLPQNINYLGQIPSFEIGKYYKKSDVFILPTFSDGFAITQLEAQSYKVPVITTPFCGDVIEHGKNGYIIPDVTAEHIVNCVKEIIANPVGLSSCSANSANLKESTIEKFGQQILNIG